MKKISVTIPCYNDSNSIVALFERITKVFAEQLPQYDYEIIYVDDCSPDDGKTWGEIKKVCEWDKRCKGVRNSRNFGLYRNAFSAMKYGTGDATFMLFGDIQEPPEALPDFVKHWENGSRVIVGRRPNSYDGPFLRFARRVYYRMIEKMSNNRQINGIAMFGLYDKSFVDVLSDIDDIQPILTGIVMEYVNDIKIIVVKQEKSARGKSNFNFWRKYDFAMMSITSYTKTLLRMVVFVAGIVGILSAFYGVFIVINKILNWDNFAAGTPTLIAGMLFLGAVQLFFLGVMGEYILSINNRTMKRPVVVIDEKINFDD